MVESAVEGVSQGPPTPSRYGHDYSHGRSPEGYGICRCGARENTDESVQPCPSAHPLTDEIADILKGSGCTPVRQRLVLQLVDRLLGERNEAREAVTRALSVETIKRGKAAEAENERLREALERISIIGDAATVRDAVICFRACKKAARAALAGDSTDD